MGKFRKYLGKKCPVCGSKLILTEQKIENSKEYGIGGFFTEEIIECSNCDYTEDKKDKKKYRNIEKNKN